jgi:hypothetical protein
MCVAILSYEWIEIIKVGYKGVKLYIYQIQLVLNQVPVSPVRLEMIVEINAFGPVDPQTGFEAKVVNKMKRFKLPLQPKNKMVLFWDALSHSQLCKH